MAACPDGRCDGSGFLYTETVDTAINPELFFCRLPDPARGVTTPSTPDICQPVTPVSRT